MRIRMVATAADPAGVKLSGHEYEVPESEARQLIDGRYAILVEAPGKKPEPKQEVAAIEPEERAADVVKRSRKSR